MNDVSIRPYTPEEYAAYQSIKPVMEQLHPWVFNANRPLPIHPDTLKSLMDDPYLRQTDEELMAFVEIWQNRREYTHSICHHQKYYDAFGRVVCDIPPEIICGRAFALARFVQKANFSLHKVRPEKIK